MDLYEQLLKLKLTSKQLDTFKFPKEDPNNENGALVESSHPPTPPINFSSSIRLCMRCLKKFNVDDSGFPIKQEECQYHKSQIWPSVFLVNPEPRYPCCRKLVNSPGCCKTKYHVVNGSYHPSFTKGYVRSKPIEKKDSFPGIYAVDCEMCETTIGKELIQVSVVDYDGNSFYDTLVKPENPILDPNTMYHGIEEEKIINATITLKDVQVKFLSFIFEETILIGHNLDNDLKVLKFIHKNIVDTSVVFPHFRGIPFKNSLDYLVEVHNLDIPTSETNKCKNDAWSSLMLLKKKIGFLQTKKRKNNDDCLIKNKRINQTDNL